MGRIRHPHAKKFCPECGREFSQVSRLVDGQPQRVLRAHRAPIDKAAIPSPVWCKGSHRPGVARPPAGSP